MNLKGWRHKSEIVVLIVEKNRSKDIWRYNLWKFVNYLIDKIKKTCFNT